MIDVDFHAHILPECDHGSENISVALEQLRLAQNAGIDIICATPHFYGQKETVSSFLNRRKASEADLKANYAPTSKEPKVLVGAEVLCFPGIEKLPQLTELCLENSNFLLLEMPFSHWSNSLLRSVEKLSMSDSIRIILAHAERYEATDVDRLIDMGISIQLNSDVLAKLLIKPKIKKWISEGSVVAVGSDIHGIEKGYSAWDLAKSRHKPLWNKIMSNTAILFDEQL